MDPEKVTWLANQIFTAFPQEVSGLKFYILDCGCVYYQGIYGDGRLDPDTGIYRDAEDGPCEVCMSEPRNWIERVLDETIVYKRKFQVGLRR
jgi:hypothetical protein